MTLTRTAPTVTTCAGTRSEDEIWCAALTIGFTRSAAAERTGFVTTLLMGSLSNRTFDYEGTRTINAMERSESSSNDDLFLKFQGGVDQATAGKWSLRIDGQPYGLRSAERSDQGKTYKWSTHNVGWTPGHVGESVEVSIREVTDPTFSVSNETAEEGESLTFTVSLDPVRDSQTTVDWNATPTSADDASAADVSGTLSGTLTFAANESVKTVTVQTMEDEWLEVDGERFKVRLSNQTSGVLLDGSGGYGTITDDEAPCSEDPEESELWCQHVTLGHAALDGGGTITGYSLDGNLGTVPGERSDRIIRHGSYSYRMNGISRLEANGEDTLRFTTTSWPRTVMSNTWTLHLGSKSLAFSGASRDMSGERPGYGFEWSSHPITWNSTASGETIVMRISTTDDPTDTGIAAAELHVNGTVYPGIIVGQESDGGQLLRIEVPYAAMNGAVHVRANSEVATVHILPRVGGFGAVSDADPDTPEFDLVPIPVGRTRLKAGIASSNLRVRQNHYIDIVRAAPADATLAGLSAYDSNNDRVPLNRGFDPEITHYSVAVAQDITWVVLDPRKSDPDATISIVDANDAVIQDTIDTTTTMVEIPVTDGTTPVSVIVTGSDSTASKRYRVDLVRADAITATLEKIEKESDRGHMFFNLTFSEPIYIRTLDIRHHAMRTSGGQVVRARRLERIMRDRNGEEHAYAARWEIEVALNTGSTGANVTLEKKENCQVAGAICNDAGVGLDKNYNIEFGAQVPLTVSIGDAEGHEETDGRVTFTVQISRPVSYRIKVVLDVREGGTNPATAGEDFLLPNNLPMIIFIDPGEQSKKPFVRIVDDGIDDDGETFIMEIVAAKKGTAWTRNVAIEKAVGIGTIRNQDPIPGAWLARFGKKSAEIAAGAVRRRVENATGSHLRIAGVSIEGNPEALQKAEDAYEPPSERDHWRRPEPETREFTRDDLLLRSSFDARTSGESGRPVVGAWGEAATTSFDATVDGVEMDGDVRSVFLGTDVRRDRWMAGVALSLSEGEGTYRLIEGNDSGDLEASLNAAYPYASLRLGARSGAWAMLGIGQGSMRMRLGTGTFNTDIATRMGAIGGWTELTGQESWLDLKLRGDTLWNRIESDAATGNAGSLSPSSSDSTRTRLVLEGSRTFTAGMTNLTPTGTLGIRYDQGDAEEGFGVDVAGGLGIANGRLGAELNARALVAHEEDGYREWGASGSLSFKARGNGEGLSFSLTPEWGQPRSGAEPLWSATDLSEISKKDEFEAEQKLTGELGYGLRIGHGFTIVTPYLGSTLNEGQEQSLRAGARWESRDGFRFSFEATRQGEDWDRIGIQAGISW